MLGITTVEILLQAKMTPNAVPSMWGSTVKAIILPNWSEYVIEFTIPCKNNGRRAPEHLSHLGKKQTQAWETIKIQLQKIVILHLCPILSIISPKNGEIIEYIKNGIGI